MKVIIAGSRTITNESLVKTIIETFLDENKIQITEVVCGMCEGVDLLGKLWAEENKIPVKEFPADWKMYGKVAGPIRNAHMAEYADAAIIIFTGPSRGSKSMEREMKKVNKPLFVYEVKNAAQ